MMIRIAVGTYLLIHGICHLVGFVVPWRLADLKEEPYKTTLLMGSIDVGDIGIRAVGVLWLVAAAACVAGAVGVFAAASWWRSLVLYATAFSMILCIFGLPGAKIGILANAVVFAYLFLDSRYGLMQ